MKLVAKPRSTILWRRPWVVETLLCPRHVPWFLWTSYLMPDILWQVLHLNPPLLQHSSNNPASWHPLAWYPALELSVPSVLGHFSSLSFTSKYSMPYSCPLVLWLGVLNPVPKQSVLPAPCSQGPHLNHILKLNSTEHFLCWGTALAGVFWAAQGLLHWSVAVQKPFHPRSLGATVWLEVGGANALKLRVLRKAVVLTLARILKINKNSKVF